MEAQLDELTSTYDRLLGSSTQQLQQLEQQLAKEEERKVNVLRCFRSFMTNKNVFKLVLETTTTRGMFSKRCSESEHACELICVSQLCVLRSMLCSQNVLFF